MATLTLNHGINIGQPAVQHLRLRLAILAAHLVRATIRGLHLGAGSALPGSLARLIQPRVLSLLTGQAARGVILIAGTNGKTTTAHLIRAILERRGWRVVQNGTGANLENGLTTALLDCAGLDGRLSADYVIFEVDENILPRLVRQVRPQLVVCLNLFRDQLDRYGEVDTISRRWLRALAGLPDDTVVILNGDDPRLAYLGQQLHQHVLYFGMTEPEAQSAERPHAVDSVYCPRCGAPLDYKGYYLSHLGDYACGQCGLTKSAPSIDSRAWSQALVGLYNKYNTLAAILAAQVAGVDNSTIRTAVDNFHAAFGRAEEFQVRDKCVRILLSKNPAGMNETIRVLQAERRTGDASVVLLVLNDRIPDGTDVSWIWDVDTEKLAMPGTTLVVGGDRAYDMALRLQYSRGQFDADRALIVQPDLRAAIGTALDLTRPDGILHILPTYSAMLQVRGVLLGHPIL